MLLKHSYSSIQIVKPLYTMEHLTYVFNNSLQNSYVFIFISLLLPRH